MPIVSGSDCCLSDVLDRRPRREPEKQQIDGLATRTCWYLDSFLSSQFLAGEMGDGVGGEVGETSETLNVKKNKLTFSCLTTDQTHPNCKKNKNRLYQHPARYG